MCQQALKIIFPLYLLIFVIFIQNPWRVPYVSTSAKNYIFFIFIHFFIFIQNPWRVPYVSTSATKNIFSLYSFIFLYLFKILGTCHMCQQAQQKDNDMCI